MTEDTTIQVVKIASVWTAWGLTSWADWAAFAATIYTTILISEWMWKKLIRPFAESKRWLSRIKRRKEDNDS